MHDPEDPPDPDAIVERWLTDQLPEPIRRRFADWGVRVGGLLGTLVERRRGEPGFEPLSQREIDGIFERFRAHSMDVFRPESEDAEVDDWSAIALAVIRREIATRTKGSPGLKPDAQNPVSGLIILARLGRGHRNRAAAIEAADVPERMVHWFERVRRSETLLRGIRGSAARFEAEVVDRYLDHLGLTHDDLIRIAEGPDAGLDPASLDEWIAQTIPRPL